MKLEYIAKGAKDAPLILLVGNELDSIVRLVSALRSLARGDTKEIAIHSIQGIEPMHGALLYGVSAQSDSGIGRSRSHPGALEWAQTPDAWEDSADIVEQFTNPKTRCADAYNYLTRFGKVNVILSMRARW